MFGCALKMILTFKSCMNSKIEMDGWGLRDAVFAYLNWTSYYGTYFGSAPERIHDLTKG